MPEPVGHPRRSRLRRRLAAQDGWGIVESLVAVLLMVVGLFGLLTMLDTSNEVTSANLRRDSGNNLAREVVERARQLPYATLAAPAPAATALAQAIPGADTATGTSWSTERRGVRYTTTVTTCVVDDPSDGVGAVHAVPCQPATGGGGGGGGSAAAPVTASLNVLGVPIDASLSGDALRAVCAGLGQSAAVDGLLRGTGVVDGILGLVRGGADVAVCPGTSTEVAFDRHPDDVTRLTATVTWNRPRPGRVVQSTLVPRPGGGS